MNIPETQKEWNDFYLEYTPLIKACVAKRLHKNGDHSRCNIEDATASTWEALLKNNCSKLKTWSPTAGYSFKNWLALVATQTTEDIIRKQTQAKKRQVTPEFEFAQQQHRHYPAPLEYLLNREALTTVIQHFTENQLRILMGADSPKELARDQGVALNTIYSRKSKLAAKARKLIEA